MQNELRSSRVPLIRLSRIPGALRRQPPRPRRQSAAAHASIRIRAPAPTIRASASRAACTMPARPHSACSGSPRCRSRPVSLPVGCHTPPPPPPRATPEPGAAAGRPRRPRPGRLLRLHQFRPGVQRQPSVCRQLQRHQLLRHRQPGEDQTADFDSLPRRAGRRLGVRPSAVHVGRGDERPARLRHAGNPAASGLYAASPPPAAADAAGRSRRRAPRPPPPPNPDRFRGVRIFDISDLANPKQVAAVQSCRGSHTHTLVIDPKDKENVYIYISGTGPRSPGGRTGGLLGRRSVGES